MAVKKEKINGIIQRELTEILATEVKDPKIGFITITGVETTSDLSYAKVYVTFLGKNYKKRDGMQALDRSNGFIRSLLAKRLTTRKVPELKFILDTSLDYGNHIESILNEINKDDKAE